MKSNEISYPKWASWTGPAALWAAAGAAGFGLWTTQGASLPLRSAAGLAVLMAVFSAVWLYRIRAARRHVAILDAYAEQELDRAQRRRPRVSRKSDRRVSHSSV